MVTHAFDGHARSNLDASMLALLDYMPAMTFSKSAESGRYLTCSQPFAEFVNKRCPEEVVGLTDQDIFGDGAASRFASSDRIALSMDEPYCFFEDVLDAAGEPRKLQTVKLIFSDEAGTTCVLGMSMDVTKAMKDKEESERAKAAHKEALSTSAVYGNIVEALSQEYFDLFYVDVETDEYIEYGSRTESDKPTAERHGTDFFTECRNNAAGLVHEEDVQRVLDNLCKEKLLAEVEKRGSYTYNYRLIMDGVPTYVSLKTTRVPGDNRHVVIGISNVDSQVRDRMTAERAMEEKRSYLRLSALAGNLVVLYYVDPASDEYTEYSSMTSYGDLGIAKHGADFFKASLQNGLRIVHPEDQELFRSQFTKENILSTIERDDTFVLDYRLASRGLPTYVRLRAAMTDEDGKPLLVVGLMDEDAQIQRECEYARNLSAAREKAIIDSLTGVKNKHAYSEWEERMNAAIRKSEQEPFAVVVCDVNGLKAVNDLQGHKEGDACIKRACMRICHTFDHSPVFRVGGDEFAVILTKGDYKRRAQLMDAIVSVPEDCSPARPGETIAAGMAEYQEGHHFSVLSVFEEADKAMYKRKQLMKESDSADVEASDDETDLEYNPTFNVRRHILIADDIELNREKLGDLLEDDYDIIYAHDGVETLEKLHRFKDEIALVLLDLRMPRMTGREVIARMQVDDELMSIPIIILTVDQDAELDCLLIGAMDFIPKPYPDIEIVKARIAKCIELSENRDLIRRTEHDRLTGLLNKEFFFRYVERLDRIHNEDALDAVVVDVNKLHSINKRYGRKFGDVLLHSVGIGVKKLARQTGGIGCREGGDTFLLYCPNQYDYERLMGKFLADVLAEGEMANRVSLRLGVLKYAQSEPDVEGRFVRAKAAAEGVKNDPGMWYKEAVGFYRAALPKGFDSHFQAFYVRLG
ncbi:MAG: diguanylate cyclase [Atopobiaceae bacterium]|nr:diguanylate cyclase [Atopobiaceae bacterium]